jgi:hypothetical protein
MQSRLSIKKTTAKLSPCLNHVGFEAFVNSLANFCSAFTGGVSGKLDENRFKK